MADFNFSNFSSDTDGFLLSYESGSSKLGVDLSSNCDFNGDGLDDLVVGDSSSDAGGNLNAGEIYVIYGTSPESLSFTANPATLNGTNGISVEGLGANYNTGKITACSDINGDGFGDVLMTAKGGSKYTVYVVYGFSNPLISSISTNDLNGTNGFLVETPLENYFPHSMVSLGDLNNDGFNDFGFATNRSAYIIYGFNSTSAPQSTPLSVPGDLTGSNGFQIDGPDTAIESLSSGFINQDSFLDIVIGCPSDTPLSRTSAGQFFVIYGQQTQPTILTASSVNGTTGFNVIGASVLHFLAKNVEASGDFNGDGFDDIVVSGLISGGPEYYALVIFGFNSVSSPQTVPLDINGLSPSRGMEIKPSDINTNFGTKIRYTDLNQDGMDDILISANQKGLFSQNNVGQGYLVFGTTSTTLIDPETMNSTVGLRFNGVSANNKFGNGIAALDFNNDSLIDLAFGAPGESFGKVYILYTFCLSGQGLLGLETHNSNGSCSLCPVGFYDSSPRDNFCSPCDLGYSSTLGSVTCTICASGTFSDAVGMPCTDCPAGQSSNSTADPTNCFNCPSDFYSLSGQTCSPCPEGQISASGDPFCYQCTEDQYSDTGLCINCKPGRVAPLGSLDLTACTCPANTYPENILTHDSSCKPCPTGALCSGGQSHPKPIPGYISSPIEPDIFVLCNPSQACLKGKCTIGYTGDYCASCSPNYYKTNSFCMECPTSGNAVYIVLFFIAFILFNILLIFINANGHEDGFFGLILWHVQFMSIFGDIPASQHWLWNSTFQTLKITLLDFGSIAPGCSGNSFSFWSIFHLQMSLPFLSLAIIFCLFWITMFLQPKFGNLASRQTASNPLFLQQLSKISTFDTHTLAKYFVGGAVFSLASLYLATTRSAISAIACETLSDNQIVLVVDHSVKCSSEDYQSNQWLAWTMIALNTICIPLVMFYISRFKSKTDSSHILFGCFITRYQPKFSFWESLIFVRKAVITILIFTISFHFGQNMSLIFWVILSSIALHSYYYPYYSIHHNRFELVSLVSSSGLVYFSLLTGFDTTLSFASLLTISIFSILLIASSIIYGIYLAVVFKRNKIQIMENRDLSLSPMTLGDDTDLSMKSVND